MARALHDRKLDEILASVSRSFYLTLTVAPRAVRTQLATTYLVARAADTIADTRMVRAGRRLELLGLLREALLAERDTGSLADRMRGDLLGDAAAPGASMERRLLERIDDCVALLRGQADADLVRSRHLLDVLIRGMEHDLTRFGDGGSGGDGRLRSLANLEELDEHAFFAAGCVGEFWSELCAAHLPVVAHLAEPEHRARAIHLGKALQLVNVIRDAPADLAEGRCYIPRSLLGTHGLTPEDLLGERRREVRPVLDELRHLALAHVDAAWPYITAIPRRAARLRLACIWPAWIALATLAKIAACEDPLAPGSTIKVHRKEVYRIMAESTAVVSFAPMLSRRHWHRRALAGSRDMRPILHEGYTPEGA